MFGDNIPCVVGPEEEHVDARRSLEEELGRLESEVEMNQRKIKRGSFVEAKHI